MLFSFLKSLHGSPPFEIMSKLQLLLCMPARSPIPFLSVQWNDVTFLLYILFWLSMDDRTKFSPLCMDCKVLCGLDMPSFTPYPPSHSPLPLAVPWTSRSIISASLCSNWSLCLKLLFLYPSCYLDQHCSNFLVASITWDGVKIWMLIH